MTNSSSFTSTEEEQQKQKFGAAILYASRAQRTSKDHIPRGSRSRIFESACEFFLYQVTNMSRRLYFCLCYTKPRRSLISNI